MQMNVLSSVYPRKTQPFIYSTSNFNMQTGNIQMCCSKCLLKFIFFCLHDIPVFFFCGIFLARIFVIFQYLCKIKKENCGDILGNSIEKLWFSTKISPEMPLYVPFFFLLFICPIVSNKHIKFWFNLPIKSNLHYGHKINLFKINVA